jgi:hypothetical protein
MSKLFLLLALTLAVSITGCLAEDPASFPDELGLTEEEVALQTCAAIHGADTAACNSCCDERTNLCNQAANESYDKCISNGPDTVGHAAWCATLRSTSLASCSAGMLNCKKNCAQATISVEATSSAVPLEP